MEHQQNVLHHSINTNAYGFFYFFLFFIKKMIYLQKIKKYPHGKKKQQQTYSKWSNNTNLIGVREWEVCHWRQIQVDAMDSYGGRRGNYNNHHTSFTVSGSCGGRASGTCVEDSVFCFLELQQGLKSRGSIMTSPNRPL